MKSYCTSSVYHRTKKLITKEVQDVSSVIEAKKRIELVTDDGKNRFAFCTRSGFPLPNYTNLYHTYPFFFLPMDSVSKFSL